VKFELWLAFVAAYTVISIIPGPSVFMVTGQALTRGIKAAFLCILGDIVGGFFLIALSLFGVGAILAASSELFQLVKWAGVLYMAYLGPGWLPILAVRNFGRYIDRHRRNDTRLLRLTRRASAKDIPEQNSTATIWLRRRRLPHWWERAHGNDPLMEHSKDGTRADHSSAK
jgi:hypothetical protein